ncbi:hypothetical protein AB0K51_27045 [Kitasatospora sp. NPDC049285]|uniref:hypothetical protein n=1 Tax=Kitasatospora sp. NPDC049285 TaxID=3157096 RepID=UPI00342EA6F9
MSEQVGRLRSFDVSGDQLPGSRAAGSFAGVSSPGRVTSALSLGVDVLNLAQSRKSFHEVRRLPDQNIWKTLFQSQGNTELLKNPRFAEYLETVPERSNCPEIAAVAEDLINLLPGPWKARVRNIYVGRNLFGAANAEAWRSGEVGVVEMNYGITAAAMIYAVLYSKYFAMIETLGSKIDWDDQDDEDNEILLMILEEVERGGFEPILVAEQSRASWLRQGSIRAAHPLLRELPAGRSQESYAKAVVSIEEFVIAHEFAHHLLGHTDDGYRQAAHINKALDDALKQYSAPMGSEELNAAQVDELRADALAVLIITGELAGVRSRERTYRATIGSIIGLTALAHINDSWIAGSGSQETHPDFLTRYEAIVQIIRAMNRDTEFGAIGDHPLGLLGQLSGWVSMVLDTWLSRHKVEGHTPINALRLAHWVFERSEQLYAELRERGITPK